MHVELLEYKNFYKSVNDFYLRHIVKNNYLNIIEKFNEDYSKIHELILNNNYYCKQTIDVIKKDLNIIFNEESGFLHTLNKHGNVKVADHFAMHGFRLCAGSCDKLICAMSVIHFHGIIPTVFLNLNGYHKMAETLNKDACLWIAKHGGTKDDTLMIVPMRGAMFVFGSSNIGQIRQRANVLPINVSVIMGRSAGLKECSFSLPNVLLNKKLRNIILHDEIKSTGRSVALSLKKLLNIPEFQSVQNILINCCIAGNGRLEDRKIYSCDGIDYYTGTLSFDGYEMNFMYREYGLLMLEDDLLNNEQLQLKVKRYCNKIKDEKTNLEIIALINEYAQKADKMFSEKCLKFDFNYYMYLSDVKYFGFVPNTDHDLWVTLTHDNFLYHKPIAWGEINRLVMYNKNKTYLLLAYDVYDKKTGQKLYISDIIPVSQHTYLEDFANSDISHISDNALLMQNDLGNIKLSQVQTVFLDFSYDSDNDILELECNASCAIKAHKILDKNKCVLIIFEDDNIPGHIFTNLQNQIIQALSKFEYHICDICVFKKCDILKMPTPINYSKIPILDTMQVIDLEDIYQIGHTNGHIK